MNINILILVIVAFLTSIYVFFKPEQPKKFVQVKEVPLFELHNYILYELDTKKVIDISNGIKAVRYKDRYEFYDFKFIDNTHKDVVTISALNGLYKNNDTITLSGDVFYTTDGGMDFFSQKAFYDKKRMLLKSDVPYIAHLEGGTIRGKTIRYDLKNKIIKSTDVNATFNIKEKTKK